VTLSFFFRVLLLLKGKKISFVDLLSTFFKGNLKEFETKNIVSLLSEIHSKKGEKCTEKLLVNFLAFLCENEW
jgi:hypothetical protein